MRRQRSRGATTGLRAAQTWAARTALVGIGLAVAVGLGSGVWAAKAPTDAERKQAIAEQLDQANAKQRANAPKPAGADAVDKASDTTRTRQPSGPASLAWDSGVSDTREAPIAKGVIEATSVWNGTVAGTHYSVYAGVSPDGRGQGLVVVQTYSASGAALREDDYLAPPGAGSLHIDSAVGQQLHLTGDTGHTYVFNVDKRIFG